MLTKVLVCSEDRPAVRYAAAPRFLVCWTIEQLQDCPRLPRPSAAVRRPDWSEYERHKFVWSALQP